MGRNSPRYGTSPHPPQKEVDKAQEWGHVALLSHWEVETAVEYIKIKHRII
jgi:hypothetical protein